MGQNTKGGNFLQQEVNHEDIFKDREKVEINNIVNE